MSLIDISLDRNRLLQSFSYKENEAEEEAMKFSNLEVIEKVRKANIREGEKEGVLVADRWQRALSEASQEKYFVCNTFERDSNEDNSNLLLINNTKEIVQGLAIGAYSIGANSAFIYICKDNLLAKEKVEEAIKSIDISINIEVKVVDRESIYGDEIASVNILHSKLNNKKVNAKYPVSKVFNNNIVVINRPETLIKVCSLFLGQEYENVVKDKFVVLESTKENNNILNVSEETTLRELIYDIGGGTLDDKEIKAISVGQSTGVLLHSDLLDIKLNDNRIILEDISKVMKIKVIYDDSCIIDLLKSYASQNRSGSCNKCVLCREGSTQIETILNDISEGKGRVEDIGLLKGLGRGIKLGAGCNFGRNIGNSMQSAIEYFNNEFDEHINRKKCSALVCKKYFTYHILGKACKGCEECLEVCPAEAIEGGNNLIHIIDQDECTKCGQCQKVCPHNAIVKAGLIKPKTPPKPVRVGTWKR